jgi:hypothetical protein
MIYSQRECHKYFNEPINVKEPRIQIETVIYVNIGSADILYLRKIYYSTIHLNKTFRIFVFVKSYASSIR